MLYRCYIALQDCRKARELLEAEVLCVDSLFMNVEELYWLQEGPRADPDICPGHHCVYVWRDVATCGRLMRLYMARPFLKLVKSCLKAICFEVRVEWPKR